jgi:hypothetical protein
MGPGRMDDHRVGRGFELDHDPGTRNVPARDSQEGPEKHSGGTLNPSVCGTGLLDKPRSIRRSSSCHPTTATVTNVRG